MTYLLLVLLVASSIKVFLAGVLIESNFSYSEYLFRLETLRSFYLMCMLYHCSGHNPVILLAAGSLVSLVIVLYISDAYM